MQCAMKRTRKSSNVEEASFLGAQGATPKQKRRWRRAALQGRCRGSTTRSRLSLMAACCCLAVRSVERVFSTSDSFTAAERSLSFLVAQSSLPLLACVAAAPAAHSAVRGVNAMACSNSICDLRDQRAVRLGRRQRQGDVWRRLVAGAAQCRSRPAAANAAQAHASAVAAGAAGCSDGDCAFRCFQHARQPCGACNCQSATAYGATAGAPGEGTAQHASLPARHHTPLNICGCLQPRAA